MSTECSSPALSFQVGGRRVVARFDGGQISSDGGIVLLRQVADRTGILRDFAKCFLDYRDASRTEHPVEQLVAQRVYGIAMGYEDLVDHEDLRRDPLFAVVAGSRDPEGKARVRVRDRGNALAGKSTLNRLELSDAGFAEGDRYKRIVGVGPHIDYFMVSTFLKSYESPPSEIILDVDSTDDPVHGGQEGRHFHGFYGHYCYLPLYVFSGEQVLLSKLLPGDANVRGSAFVELRRIVIHIRSKWPGTRIIIRGDSGFLSDEIMSFCEQQPGVDYVLGMAKNPLLLERIRGTMRKAARRYRESKKKVRLFQDVHYKTRHSWSRRRRVVAKAEHMEEGSNPRFVVTSIAASEYSAQELYEGLYCQRGDMENRIKEQQLDMFSDRTSTGSLAANQLRLYFSTVSYMLMQALRRLGLHGTEMAKSQCGTIRTRLLKIGAIIRVTTRKVWVSMPTACPSAAIFARVHTALMRC